MDSPALEVENLQKVFRKRGSMFRGWRVQSEEWALKGVSFRVERGETYGLLGPNGSGKSTLIRVLSTLLLADGGSVRVMGRSLPAEERAVRRVIGRVSVDAAFYKKLSARENLLYAAQLYGIGPREAETRARAILERLGLDPKRFNEPLEEMSRGQQQKIAITRAILVDPPLLLLDEPTTGLDPRSRRDVQEFLEAIRAERGTSIFLTTHDMAEAERLCPRIGFLTGGQLVAEGTAAELKAKAGNAATLDDAFIALSGARLGTDD